MDEDGPRNFFRVGYSSIKTARIEPRIALLATLMRKQLERNPQARRAKA